MFWLWKNRLKFNPEVFKKSWPEIFSVLSGLCDPVKIHWRDKYYKIPVNPAYVMRSVNSFDYKYQKESRDCDDFVRIFRGELSEMGWGNLLAMDISIQKRNGKQHALIGFLQGGKIVFGEPQTGEMVDIGDAKIIRITL